MNVKTCRLCKNLEENGRCWCAQNSCHIGSVGPYCDCGFSATWEGIAETSRQVVYAEGYLSKNGEVL